MSNPRAITALLVLTVLVAYWPSTGGDFFSDDFIRVVGNQELQTLPLIDTWRVFVERVNPWEYLPVREVSYRLDLALFGLQPFGYHAHNIVLYAIACLAVWLCCSSLLELLRRSAGATEDVGRQGDGWICAAVTALFAAHPAHVESVGWISGRKDLLSGLFALLSLWQFAKAIQPDRPDWKRVVAATLFFTLALMSKTTMLPVAIVAILLGGMRSQTAQPGQRWAALRATAPMVVLAGVWFWVSLNLGAETQVRADPFTTEIVHRSAFPVMILSILGYLVKILLFPLKLRLIYDVYEPGFFSTVAPIIGGVALIGGTVGAFWTWRRASVVGLGAAMFVLFGLPYLQIIPYSTWSLVNDRHLFLSIFAAALPLGVLSWRSRRRWVPLALVLVTLVGVAFTYRQAAKWGNLERLIADASRLAPRDFYAQQLFIEQRLLPQGRYDEARRKASGVRDPLAAEFLLGFIRLSEAVTNEQWETAQREASSLVYLVDRSSHPELQLLLGRLAERRGDDVEAARHYYRAERIGETHGVLEAARRGLGTVRSLYADSLEVLRRAAIGRADDVVAQANLANLQMELFMLEEAIERYRWILQGHANLAAARYNLGLAYLRQDRHRDAVREIRRAISGGISNAIVWNNLGNAHKRLGDIDAAEGAYRRALILDPHDCYAAINLGRLYLALLDRAQATAAFQQAQQSACGPDVQELIDTYLRQVAVSQRG